MYCCCLSESQYSLQVLIRLSKILITLNLCTQYSWMCLILFKDKKKGPISRTSNPVLQPVPVGVYVSVNDVHRGQDGLKVKIRYYFISRRVLLLIQIKKKCLCQSISFICRFKNSFSNKRTQLQSNGSTTASKWDSA